MINSRNINDLEPKFRQLITRWQQACADVELDILITSTYRDNDYQNYLYSLGRTKKGVICTNKRGGESNHNKKIAIDFCIMQGKVCDWNNKTDFTRAGIIAETLGLKWAGRWQGKLKETGHIEL